MRKKDVIKIFFLALIAGNIMGIVITQIFGELSLLKFIQMQVALIAIIVFLFVASTLWNRKLRVNSNSDKKSSTSEPDKDVSD